jgi:hypothetical protein
VHVLQHRFVWGTTGKIGLERKGVFVVQEGPADQYAEDTRNLLEPCFNR